MIAFTIERKREITINTGENAREVICVLFLWLREAMFGSRIFVFSSNLVISGMISGCIYEWEETEGRHVNIHGLYPFYELLLTANDLSDCYRLCQTSLKLCTALGMRNQDCFHFYNLVPNPRVSPKGFHDVLAMIVPCAPSKRTFLSN